MNKSKPAVASQKKPLPYKKLIIIIAVLIIGAIAAYLFFDTSNAIDNRTETDAYLLPASQSDIEDGAVLSQKYCRSCHLLPNPQLLNKNKWKSILPQMGIRLGIKAYYGESYTESIKSSELIVPDKPLLTDEQWQHIISYYMAKAPMFLPAQKRTIPITRTMPFFNLEAAAKSLSGGQVLATYIKIDTSVKPTRVFVANGQSHKLYLLNSKLKVVDSVKTTGPVVDMCFTANQILVCMIGKELGANDDKAGSVAKLKISTAGKMSIDTTPLFKDLVRPVEIIPADINGDHQTDYLICEFGNLIGALTWMENKGDGTFIKHIISNLPGAVKAYIDYDNNSKLPNIWVLFTQGQERISHLLNNGNGTFKEIPIMRFPAIYGSSFFERVDVNHDGLKDIVYTCGDNGNATLVLKPYHGVYIYINKGNDKYEQQFFYPINGCYKAIARDFDGDGNIDIATVSLYTDARQTEEGFVYFKNKGALNFEPHALPLNTRFERAVTLADGDLNGDGKSDLIIGNAYFDFGPFGYNISEPLFYYLKNKAGTK
ncbi:VCBS repeat-containing protein [Inquilinus sp. KBS0705]|nr:VCBS repeat-containing protein [Inquilinus sp. KBS0705]